MTPLVIRLRELRERAGLSQGELAARASTTQTTISKLENGKGRIVHLDILERVAKVIGVSPIELLGEVPSPKRAAKSRRPK